MPPSKSNETIYSDNHDGFWNEGPTAPILYAGKPASSETAAEHGGDDACQLGLGGCRVSRAGDRSASNSAAGRRRKVFTGYLTAVQFGRFWATGRRARCGEDPLSALDDSWLLMTTPRRPHAFCLHIARRATWSLRTIANDVLPEVLDAVGGGGQELWNTAHQYVASSQRLPTEHAQALATRERARYRGR